MTVAPQLMDAIVTTNNEAMMRDFVEGTNPLLMYRSYSQIGCKLRPSCITSMNMALNMKTTAVMLLATRAGLSKLN